MSGGGLDTRKSFHIVRAHRKLFIGITVLGFLAGIIYAFLTPPAQSSQALVVYPSPPSSIATETYIAKSDPVLESALHDLNSGMSLGALRSSISVSNLTSTVISFTGSARSAGTAEEIANAISQSFVSYRSSARSPVPPTQVKILQPATNTTGRSHLMQFVIYGIIGLLSGALIAFIVVLAIGRNNRRLKERDGIADSIGVPVILSIPVAHPVEAAEWRKLLEEYEPDVVHAWQLRKALSTLGVTDVSLNLHGNGASVTVLALSSDQRGLALGPQLAAFAAARGIPTTLVVGGGEHPDITATLRTACATPLTASSAEGRAEDRRPLQLVDDIHPDLSRLHRPGLVVVVTIIDCRTWQIPGNPRTDTTVLGVSAGVATAEQLARAATVAAISGRDITGILVADPDPADRTTGRLPQMTRSAHRMLPSRLNGVQTEIRT